MLASGSGGNREFLVAIVEISLREIKATPLQHLAPNCRCRSIAAYHHTGGHRMLLTSFLVAQLENIPLQIDSTAAHVEVELDTPLLGSIHKCDIQIGARNGVDHLGLTPAVRLEC